MIFYLTAAVRIGKGFSIRAIPGDNRCFYGGSTPMEVSVIVPAHNRQESLIECVNLLLRQDFCGEYEIVVVDDGSDAGYLKKEDLPQNERITYLKQAHEGPAAARNSGLAAARGEYVIFIGDDIMVRPDFIRRHCEFLQKHPDSASAGLTVWHYLTPNEDLSRVLQYIGLGNFSTDTPDDCGFFSFTTSNIALPRRYLQAQRFDEKFPYPAMEDNELGLRLKKNGLRIRFNSRARAFHKHQYTIEHLRRRQFELGYSIGYFLVKHPEVEKIFVRPRWQLALCFMLKAGIWSFLGQYHKIAVCAYEKHRGRVAFKKNVES